MNTPQDGSAAIDAYIAGFPAAIQERLQAMRATIRAAAPDAAEAFSYQMPAFALKGNLVYFGAAKQHIGFYPTPSGIAAFQEALANYKGAKGSVQFPHDQPLPLELVAQIVRFRVAENLAAAQAKATRRRGSAAPPDEAQG